MMYSEKSEIETMKILSDSFKTIAPREVIRSILAEYIDIQTTFGAAIKEVRTKLEILDDEFHYRYKRNPIHSIQSRLKTPESIISKLLKKGNISDNFISIKDSISDLAGIRVICQYVDDIYTIFDLLANQNDLTVLRVSDYIKHPKDNGYRSLHMLVEIPVFFAKKTEHVKVEIQLRTIAMDYWAGLEHELKYKNADIVTAEVKAKLLECANAIAETDYKMQEIYKIVTALENNE